MTTAEAFAADVVSRVRQRLQAAADPQRAEAMSRYMRGQFAFFGLGMADRRRLEREALAGVPAPTSENLGLVAEVAWAEPERELQYFAVDYLRRYIRLAEPQLLNTVEELITTKSWWDTVDALASHTVGPLARRHPQLRVDLDRWLRSDDMWLIRTAILHQLTYKADTDAAWLFDACRRHAGSPEFFIRKAIGWVLRTYAAVDPHGVAAFVGQTELSTLSRREALRGVERAR